MFTLNFLRAGVAPPGVRPPPGPPPGTRPGGRMPAPPAMQAQPQVGGFIG